MTRTKEISFFIGDFDGRFLAATKSEPLFCIERDTKDEVIRAALAAWEFYLGTMGEAAKAHVRQRKPVRPKISKKFFSPDEVVLAVA